MATQRLTKNIRKDLCDKLLERAFKARAQEIVQEIHEFAIELYRDVLGDDVERVMELPDGWLPKGSEVTVVFAGEVQCVYFGGSFSHIVDLNLRRVGAESIEPVEKVNRGRYGRWEMPMPAKMTRGASKSYDARHPLCERYKALGNKETDLIQEMDSARRTAEAAMNSVTTVKKLIEVWPEVEEFAKVYLNNGERKAVLPMIPRAALNAKLGLPPAEALEKNEEGEVAGGTVA